MKYTLYTFFLVAFTISLQAQTVVETIQHDNLTREYRLRTPSDFSIDQSLPLVLNFHGLGSNALQQEFYSQFNTLAESEKFIICAPEGIDNAWNSGFGLEQDDLGFVDNLIDSLHARYNINLDRVYSTGMSNGGYMSYFLACNLPDRIRAIASVTGTMTPLEFQLCAPNESVPVMQIHGTMDETVIYEGYNFGAPIEDVVNFWVENNGCDMAPTLTEDVPDIDMTDGCTAERFVYTNCEGETSVEFYKVTGGGHTWPGAINIGSPTCNDFKAQDEIWRFFNQFGGETVATKDVVDASTLINALPNPFEDNLTIELLSEDIQSLEIVNAIGQRVYTASDLNKDQLTISTENLSTGLYIIQLKTAKGIALEKVVKQ